MVDTSASCVIVTLDVILATLRRKNRLFKLSGVDCLLLWKLTGNRTLDTPFSERGAEHIKVLCMYVCM